MIEPFGLVERMRWLSVVAALSAVVAGVALGGVGVSASSSSLSSLPVAAGALDPRIAVLGGSRSIVAIVQFGSGVSAARARAEVVGAGGRVVGELPIIRGLAARMSAAEARSLAGRSGVHAVSLNTVVRSSGGPWEDGAVGGAAGFDRASAGSSLDLFDQTLGVAGLWRRGDTGQGVGVAVIDTGVDGGLSAFRGADGHSRVIASAVANPNATSAYDSYGHGTDVAGLIAGDSSGGQDPAHAQFAGVAPGADLVSVKVSDEQGRATVLDVIEGLQFVVEHQHDYHIRVVNLSLDSTTAQSYRTDPLDAAVEAAWLHGIAVVAAAGNRGPGAGAVTYAPANDPYVITVGATDQHDTPTPADDTIAAWSSRGSTQDGYQKPEVYAPGAHIVSLLAPGSQFATACQAHDCLIDGDYLQTSGTSMATPMIAGLAADLLQTHPDWTPSQLKGALTTPQAAANPTIQEDTAPQLAHIHHPQAADQNLTPSPLLDPDGNPNPTNTGWSFGSWSTTTGPLAAAYAFGSWSCQTCTNTSNPANPSFGSWSFGSWSTLPTT